MKLWQSLELLTKLRVNSNQEIPQFMKRYAQMGKFDEPKKNALITELLVRMASLEEKLDLHLRDIADTNKKEYAELEKQKELQTVQVNPTWQETLKKSKELGVFQSGLKRNELEALIEAKTVVE